MPTYDYRCDACEHQFEEFQSITAKPLKKCPECGKNKLVRLIGTGAGVIFKGSGFYETDYRSSNYQKDAKADKESSSKASETSSSSSDSGSSKSDASSKSSTKTKTATKSTG